MRRIDEIFLYVLESKHKICLGFRIISVEFPLTPSLIILIAMLVLFKHCISLCSKYSGAQSRRITSSRRAWYMNETLVSKMLLSITPAK